MEICLKKISRTFKNIFEISDTCQKCYKISYFFVGMTIFYTVDTKCPLKYLLKIKDNDYLKIIIENELELYSLENFFEDYQKIILLRTDFEICEKYINTYL